MPSAWQRHSMVRQIIDTSMQWDVGRWGGRVNVEGFFHLNNPDTPRSIFGETLMTIFQLHASKLRV